MVEQIKSGSSLSFGSEKLRELCKLVPDDVEVCLSAAHLVPVLYNFNNQAACNVTL